MFYPLPGDDPARRRPDISLARKMLGWEPAVSLDEGLGRTIAYFRQLRMQEAGQVEVGRGKSCDRHADGIGAPGNIDSHARFEQERALHAAGWNSAPVIQPLR